MKKHHTASCKTFHTRADNLKQNIPSDCWFENSACVKVKRGIRQNDGNSRGKTEKVKKYVEVWGKVWKGKWLFKNTKNGQSSKGDTECTGGLLNWSACTCWKMPARFWHLLWVEGSPCQLLWSQFPRWLTAWRWTLSCLLPRRCLSCSRKSCRTPPRELFLPHTHSTHTLRRNQRKSHQHYILY